MALSGVTNYNPTADVLIQAAYRKLGISVTLTATQSNNGLAALNMLFKEWGPKGLKVWLQEETGFALVESDKDYSVTASTTDLPIEIDQAFLRNISSKEDTPLEIITRDEYIRLPNRTTEGTPTQVYYHRDKPEGTSLTGWLYVWPAPDSTAASTYTINIAWRKPIDNVDSTNHHVEFPQEWYRAIVWNLAKELMLEVDVPESVERRIVSEARITLEDAEASDIGNNASVMFQPDYDPFRG